MSKLRCCILSFVLLFGLVACKSLGSGNTQKYTPGTYSATAKGMGTVSVTMTVDANKITDLKLDLSGETAAIGQAAGGDLKQQILKAQSAKIDGVSGATITSTAVKTALADCMKQAGRGSSSAVSAASVTKENPEYKAGTYTSTQMGMGGKFDITVTFSKDAIKSIDIGNNNETLMVGSEALRILPKRIIDNQSLKIDVVSGATYSSNAVIYGVRDCVKQAGGDLDALLAAPLTSDMYADYDKLSHKADILIIGGGLSGSSAAISAVQNGGNVILLEEKEYLGGNSVLSTGTFLLGGTSIQKSLGIEDDQDSFYQWIMKNSENAKDPVQAAMVAKNGQKLIDWFASMGLKFNTKQVNATDGSKVNRGHALSPNIGAAVSTLADYMAKNKVDIRYSTKVESFIFDPDGKVVGVNATDFKGRKVQYYGKEIVLASGGFGANHEMIVKNWGADYDALVYGGAKGMDGALLNAAVKLGAATVDMNLPHVDATLECSKGITITTNLLRNCGGIIIRQSTGQRFVDEQASHSEVAAAKMHTLGDKYYYEIFDKNALTYSEAVGSKTKSYIDMGLTTEYPSIEAMAKGLGVDKDALTQTLEKYNSAVRGDTSDIFGRKAFYKELAAPYYVMKTSNGVACTVGGLRVNGSMQVLDTKGNPIPNVYAIGEIVGGYLTHYIGGDSLARSSISGKIVGEELAALNAKKAN
jgi:fumarate reductase flavoprotein subunit